MVARKEKPVPAPGVGATDSNKKSLDLLRRRGYVATKVEQWIPSPQGRAQKAIYAGGFRRDLLGFADLLAFHTEIPVVLLVQTTSKKQVAAHLRQYRRDIKVRENILAWISQRGRELVIHGWYAAQTAAGWQWRCEERYVTTKDFAARGE
jgi:hypothetical protein